VHPRKPASDPQTPTADEIAGRNAARLRERYDQLAAGLRATGVPDERIVVVEYFDPTHDRSGALCDGVLKELGNGIQAAEAGWAYRSVLLAMNREIRAAARRHGWRVVTGVVEAFERHGYCEDKPHRWIRTWDESVLLHGGGVEAQRLSGTMHPNGPGHNHTATLIAPALAATLALTPPPGSAPADLCDECAEPEGMLTKVALTLGGALAGLMFGLLLFGLRRRPV
jgi:hypothetical protein